MELLQDIPKEELIKKVISVEFNRFLNYYKKSKDLASQEGSSSRAEIPSDGTVRYFINIGTRDDYDWMTLKDYLRDTLQVGQDDVFKVDCKEGFSFFNTNADLAEKVMEVLNAVNINGRKINVEISKNEGGRSSGRRDHNGRSGGGRSGGGGFSGRREGGNSGGGYRGNSGGGNREGGFNREGGSGFRPRTSSTGGSDRRTSDSRDSGRRGEGRANEGRSTERRSSGFEGARRTPRRSND
jgi:ATP-dependent RNA helicase DeaD